MPTLYGDAMSGNCYKIQLTLAHLQLDYDWVGIDILAGETRTAEFLALNPNGRIPLWVTDDGVALAESNAILYLLARDSDLFPAEPVAQAQVLQWQFFEQYSHEPFIATSRYIHRYLGNPPSRAADLEARRAPGEAALAVMDRHLETRAFFVGDSYTIADISLYAYTHVAPEGGFELTPYVHVCRWLERVAEQPGHIVMNASNT